jgi:hypothetical protein
MIDPVERLAQCLDPHLAAKAAARRLARLDRRLFVALAGVSRAAQDAAHERLCVGPNVANVGARLAPLCLAWVQRRAGNVERWVSAPIPPRVAWPPPSLQACPSDLCASLLSALPSLTRDGDAWLEWLLRQVEMRGLAAGLRTDVAARQFQLADALSVLTRAYLVHEDARFLNALLRVGDRLLRRPRMLDADIQLQAALLAACLVREAGLNRLETESTACDA